MPLLYFNETWTWAWAWTTFPANIKIQVNYRLG